ncbi:transcription initiation factor IIB [Halogeometricum pallidum]|nr:TFIIB-type zinc ribbon-containing protein [Halogeometricum pallidum]
MDGRSGTTVRRTQESTERETSEFTCPECTAPLQQDETHGETTCIECGLVVTEDEIDRGPEWRCFNAAEKEDRSRVGGPTTKRLHDDGLSTVIDWQNSDAHGNALSSKKRQQMQRLRTWDERFRSKDAQERNLKHALGEVDRMASALGLPEAVRETASVVYRQALDADLLRGRSIEGVASASLYAGARQMGTPRSLSEVTTVSRVEKLRIQRAYSYIAQELGLGVELADPHTYVTRFVSDLDVTHEVEQIGHELLDAGNAQNVHSGKSPVGLAAAAVYAASRLANQRVTQETVAATTDVSMVTIRNRYQELLTAYEIAE